MNKIPQLCIPDDRPQCLFALGWDRVLNSSRSWGGGHLSTHALAGDIRQPAVLQPAPICPTDFHLLGAKCRELGAIQPKKDAHTPAALHA